MSFELESTDKRPCERKCRTCGKLKHFSRFARRPRKTPNGTVWEFDPDCRDCQQIKRNEKKNLDRPLAIVKARAQVAAQKAEMTTEFFMVQMNYTALVPEVGAAMAPGAKCKSCGHEFMNERDIQFDHILPPRGKKDWARLHARNVHVLCGPCNNTKRRKPYDIWLDEQEGARQSNLESQPSAAVYNEYQCSFDFMP